MKKLVIFLFILIVAVGVGGYFLLPTNIKWDKYVQEMSADVKARTGLTLNVTGQPTFSMKPQPVLKLGQVRLGNVSGTEFPLMMTASGAEILLDTRALFRRQIKIKKITLSAPRFAFETLPNGKWNWQVAFFDKAGVDGTIGFESLLLTDGVAEVRPDKYTPVQKWDRINAELFADSLRGPFFFEGKFGAKSSDFGFSLKVEKFAAMQSPDFSLRLTNAPAEATFLFNGRYGLTESDRGTLSGSLAFDIRKTDRLFSLMHPQETLPAALFQPVEGNLRWEENADTRTVFLNDVLFKYGTSTATGKMTVRTLSPQEASVLQAQKENEAVNDEIVLRDPNNPTEEVRITDEPVQQTKVAENLLPKVVNGSFIFSKFDAEPIFGNLMPVVDFMGRSEYFKKPDDTFSVDLTFDEVNYKKDVMHQLKAVVGVQEGGLSFKQASVAMPGNAFLSGEADLIVGKNPMLSGKGGMEADNLTAWLNWLGISLPEGIPQNQVRPFKAQGDFKLARNGAVFKQLNGSLDQNDFSGDFAVRFGKRKAVSMSGKIKELDFARYFPEQSKLYTGKRPEFAKLSVIEQVKTTYGALAFLNDIDLNVNLETDRLSFADIKAENVKADFSAVRGRAKIKSLSIGNVLASSLEMSGELEGFGLEPKFNEVNMKLDLKQVSSMAQTFGVSLPTGISPQDKMSLSGSFSGTVPFFRFKTGVHTERIDAVFRGDLRQSAPAVYDCDMTFDVRHSNLRSFVRFFTEVYRPVLSNPGDLVISGRLQKNNTLLQLSDLKGSVASSVLSAGTVKVTDFDKTPKISVDMTWNEFSPLGLLPQMNLAENQTIRTPENVANMWERDGMIADMAVVPDFAKKPFDFSFLGNYEADIALKSNKTILNSMILNDWDSVIKLQSGKITLDLRRAVWNGANFGGIFNFETSADGTLNLHANWRLSRLNVPAKLFAAEKLDLGNLTGTVLNANLKATGKTSNELVESVNGTGQFGFESGVLYGFDAQAMNDAVSRGAKTEETERFALKGQTELNHLSVNVDVGNGEIRLGNLSGTYTYKGEENSLVPFSYDLYKQTLSGGILFPPVKADVPATIVRFEKNRDMPLIVSENIASVLQFIEEQKEEAKRQEIHAREVAIQEKIDKRENERIARMDWLKMTEDSLTVIVADLNTKVKTMKPLAERAYMVSKSLNTIETAYRDVSDLLSKIKKVTANEKNNPSADFIKKVEQQMHRVYTVKEREISTAYDTGMLIGTRGAVADTLRQANALLRTEAKVTAVNKDVPDIDANIPLMMQEIEVIKAIQAQSDAEGNLEKLTVLLAQAEVGLDKIKKLRQKTTEAIARYKEKLVAEEKAKQEAEERARQEAEAKAAAEQAAKEAAERARQATISRTGGETSGTVLKSGGNSGGVLQALDGNPVAGNQTDTEKKNDNSIIIRRR